MSPVSTRPSPAGVTRAGTPRLDGIDLLRGLVIVIMALDHVRDYFFLGRHGNALALATTTPALFFTRWITHFCAPTFVFLAGVSAWLQAARGKTGWPLTRFLLARGAWLVLLEITVVGVGWQFWQPSHLILQVIWAIGVSMIVLGLVCRLPVNAVLGLGAAILLVHDAFDSVTSVQLGGLGRVWIAVHEGGMLAQTPLRIVVAYPIGPWVGIMLLGFGLGRVFTRPEAERRTLLRWIGLGMTAAFLVLRGLDVYGDPGHWHREPAPWQTLGDFVDVGKYPPSLQYALMTLGPVLALLPLLERMPAVLSRFFLAFGRAPLFAYVVHLYLAHGLALLLGLAMGYPLHAFVNPIFTHEAPTWGLSLPGTYLAWLVVVALLYGPTRWFAGVKARRRDWWLSYL